MNKFIFLSLFLFSSLAWSTPLMLRPLAKVSFSQAEQVSQEGQTALVEMGLDHTSDNFIYVPYQVSGSARFGSDHNLQSGILIFFPGQQIATFSVDIFSDQETEIAEDIVVKITAPISNATFGSIKAHTIKIPAEQTAAFPIANFTISPPFGEAPLGTTLDASQSFDPDGGSILQYHFDFGDGETLVSTFPVVTHMFNEAGIYQVKLKVLDDENIFSEEKNISLTVAQPNAMPVAVIHPSTTSGYAPMTVHFDGNDSHDPDGSIASCEWTMTPSTGDKGQKKTIDCSTDLTFAQVGSYQVTLKVTSADNFTDTETVTIQAQNDDIKPTLAFDPENNTTIITDVPTVSIFYQDAQTGINTSSLLVQLDGENVTNRFQVDADKATLQFTSDFPLPEGAHSFQASISDNNGNIQSITINVSVDLGEVDDAFIAGHVEDLDGNPIEGAGVTTVVNPVRSKVSGTTDAQGNYKIKFNTGGNYQLKITKGGFTASIKPITLVAGRDSVVDKAILMNSDPQITPILASTGGNAANSTGTIAISIPAGALAGDIEFSSTQAETGKALVRPLPPLSQFTMAMDNQPSGTVFNTPADMTIANTLGFPAGMTLPYGIVDDNLGQWVDSGRVGTVSNDGTKIVFKADHFSQYDLNYPNDPKDDYKVTQPKKKKNADKDPKKCGSRINCTSNSLGIDYLIAGVKRFGKMYGLQLSYQSASAFPTVLLEAQNDRVTANNTIPDNVAAKIRFASSLTEGTFVGETNLKPSLVRNLENATNANQEFLNSGSYQYNVELGSTYSDAEYATAAYFGGPAIASTGVKTLEPISLGSELFDRTVVENNRNSVFGAGWTLNGHEKLYEDPEGTVVLTDGSGRSKIFQPLAAKNGMNLEKIAVNKDNSPSDIHNMIYHQGFFYAADCANNVVYRIDLQGRSTVIAGDGTKETLDCPMSVAPSKRGGFYVADSGNHRIIKIDTKGKSKVVAGAKSDIGSPVWVSEDEVLAVHFISGNDIKIISPHDGRILTYSTNNGGYVPASLNNPTQIHYDRFGNLYVVDSGNHRIVKMVTGSREVLPIFGGRELFNKKLKERKFDANEVELREPVSMSFDPILKRYFILEKSGRTLLWDGVGHDRVVALDLRNNSIKHMRGNQFEKDNHPFISALAYSPEVGLAYAEDNTFGITFSKMKNRTRKERRLLGEINYASPVGEFSSLKKLNDGTYERKEIDQTTYKYLANGYISDIITTEGHNLHYTYDNANRLISLSVPGSGAYTFIYGGSGRISRIIDPAGRTTIFDIDFNGNLISIENAEGEDEEFSYDNNHLMIGSKDQKNRVTTYQYQNGRLTGETYEGNRQRLINPASLIGLVNTLKKKYTELPRIKPSDIKSTFTSPEGRSEAIEIDNFGGERSVTNGLGKTRFTERDSEGSPTLDISETGSITSEKVYTALGNPSKIIDANGATTIQYANTFNKPSTIIDELGKTTAISYSATGQVSSVQDPLGNQTTIAYHASGAPSSITDASGKVTNFEVDNLGNTTAIIDSLGHRTEFTFDAAGNKTSMKDPEGNVTAYEYNSLNQLTKTTDALNGETRFTYFPDGKLESITDAKDNTTSYAYGASGLVINVTNPANQTEVMSYDKDDNLIAKILRDGTQVSFNYDANNQLTSEVYPDNMITREYSDDGLLVSVIDNDSQVTMNYDEKQRLTQVVQSNAPSDIMEYGYNEVGLKGRMELSDFIRAGYLYDANQNLTQISASIFGKRVSWSQTFDNLQRPQTETFSNEVTTNYDFDELSRPVSIAHAINQNAISQFDYSYSDNGNITQIAETIAGLQNGNATKTHSYNYDVLNRLTQASSYKNEVFSMDLLGNIINQNQIYNNLNQMSEDQHRFFAYDSRGNLILITNKIGTKKTEMSYSKQNQLTLLKIKEDGVTPAITISYKHDGMRRRIERAVINHTDPSKSYLRKFIYDGEDILAELDENNNYVAGYLHGPGIDNVIAMVRDVNNNHRFEDDEVFYFTRDHLGSIKEITDRNGKVIQRYYYSAYGETKIEKVNPTSNHKALENRYAFTGRELDVETGYYDYRERTFIPFMKMFAQPDPIGFDSGDFNDRRYAGNSPLVNTDPFGENTIVGAAIGSAILPGVGTVIGAAIGTAAAWYIGSELADLANAYAKGGKQNIRDSGLVGVSDADLQKLLDKASGKEKLRYIKEQKSRKERNKKKRNEKCP